MGELLTQTYHLYDFDGTTFTATDVPREGTNTLTEIPAPGDFTFSVNEFLDSDYYSGTNVEFQYLGRFIDADGTIFYMFHDLISGVYQLETTQFLSDVQAGTTAGFPTSINTATDPMWDGTNTVPFCFAKGTQIAVPGGQRAVEILKVGDLIATEAGDLTPVKWVGVQTVSTRFGHADRLMIVRVRAGALGDGLPLNDLTLTADHALLIDGLLINVGALVNGFGINFVPPSELGERYTVYHIETEAHDVILAEGAPAETYIDYAARRSFDNYAEYVALYGEDRTIPEMAAPRISSTRMLPDMLKARFGLTQVA